MACITFCKINFVKITKCIMKYAFPFYILHKMLFIHIIHKIVLYNIKMII